jgi:two-component system cell cycle response regulator CtrA
MERGPKRTLLAVRMAGEGVPVKAIARILQWSSGGVYDVVNDAIESGVVVSMPATDWKIDTRRPLMDTVPLRLALQQTFRLSPQQTRVLEALMARRVAAQSLLHVVSSTDGHVESDPKIVQIIVHRLRNALAPYGVAIECIWGQGYSIPAADIKKIHEILSQEKTGAVAGRSAA